MNPIVILALTAFLSLNSFAAQKSSEMISTERDQSNANNYFEELGQMFKTGIGPDPRNLVGVAWAGRCFQSVSPSTPINAGYIFREKASADVGPIGLNSQKNYEATSYWKPALPANYYDSQTLEQVLANTRVTFTDVQIQSNQIDFLISGTKSALRLSGKYLVEELSNSNSVVLVRCYYFIPEYQNH